ncbi:MAG: TRAP transporter substrate-binding protein DctP [Amaricoccus sp.]
MATTAPAVVHGFEFFKKTVEESSGGTLKVDIYPGEQAGKALQMWDLVKAGAVDLGDFATGYVSSDKLPLIGVLELPGMHADLCALTEQMQKLTGVGGAIYESELKPQGMRVLAVLPYPPYGPSASRVEIDSVDDLQGLKTRNAGGLMELTVAALGGVPVKMTAPEIYQSLQRGTLDAVLLAYLGVTSYDLQSVAGFGTTGYSFGNPGDILGISERKFQSLTPEQQQVLIDAGQQTAMNWCKAALGEEEASMEKVRAAGMKIHEWTPEQVDELNEKTKSVAENWASTLDSRGKPASEVMNTLKAALTN